MYVEEQFPSDSMSSATERSLVALAHGSVKKRNNAIAALVMGLVPAVIISWLLPTTWDRWLVDVLVGLVWANAFEYVYHRWLLHSCGGFLAKGHMRHHITVGTPEEAEHATLGQSPGYVVAMFVTNGAAALLGGFLLRTGITPGIFVGWAAYVVAVEEIHWRFHLGGWLPDGLRAARIHHLAHHDIPGGRYNILLPLFDFLFSSIKPPIADIAIPRMTISTKPALLPKFQELGLIAWALILMLDYHFLRSPQVKRRPAAIRNALRILLQQVMFT